MEWDLKLHWKHINLSFWNEKKGQITLKPETFYQCSLPSSGYWRRLGIWSLDLGLGSEHWTVNTSMMSRIWWKPYLYISLTHSVAQNKKTSLPQLKLPKNCLRFTPPGRQAALKRLPAAAVLPSCFLQSSPWSGCALSACVDHTTIPSTCVHHCIAAEHCIQTTLRLEQYYKHTKHKGCTSVILRHTNWWACWMFILWQFENPTHVFVPSNKIATFSWLSNEDIHCIHTFVNGDFQ